MYCKNCGTQNADGAKFCRNCGQPLDANTYEHLNTSVSVPTHSSRGNGRRILSIALIIVGLAGLVFGIIGFTGGSSGEPYDAREGVVMVYSRVWDSSGNPYAMLGTGFAIGKPGKPVEYIVTNGHVVEYGYALPREYEGYSGEVDVYFSNAEHDYVTAQVVYYSPSEEKDIAILKLPSPTDKRKALLIRDSSDVNVGDKAYALGYPGIASNVAEFTTYDEEDITLTDGIISKRTKPAGNEYDAFQMSTPINSGNSGGPLVDENGSVIGISSAVALDENGSNASGISFAITSEELLKVLDSEKIEYSLAGGGPSPITYVCLVIGIIALGAGIITRATGAKKPRRMQ